MTTQTPQIRRRTIDAVDTDHYRARRLSLRGRTGCDIMRGATATIWTLVATAVLMLAVVAFAPRNTVTPGVASSGDQVTIAARSR